MKIYCVTTKTTEIKRISHTQKNIYIYIKLEPDDEMIERINCQH